MTFDTSSTTAAWNWTQLCPTGVQPWIADGPTDRHLAPCFQKVFLEVPLLALLAILSTYKLGALHRNQLESQPPRHRWQRIALNVRLGAVGGLLLLPLLQLCTDGSGRTMADDLLCIVQTMAFAAHFAYVRALRDLVGPSRSHRGPLALLVVWSMQFMLVAASAARNDNDDDNSSLMTLVALIAALLLNCLYAFSLILAGRASPIDNADDDTAALLGPTAAGQRRPLGAAQDDANPLSQLTFTWAGALIRRGLAAGGLRTAHDLFELPAALNVRRLAARMQLALDRQPRLLWALHSEHGWEFYGIGVLRLVGDVAGLGGPLLLGALLSHRAPKDSDAFDAMPYWYAVALFGSSLTAALCRTHFGWRCGQVTSKMQITLITSIYTKALRARTLDSGADGGANAPPSLLNLMSTDTDRIIGACQCVHALWSVPFQLAISLWLLYQQIGVALVAALAFLAVAFPLNNWLVRRIKQYAQRMMSAKDARMSVCSEALASAKSIKLLALVEPFCARIDAERAGEVRWLRAGLYLNAVVEYIWAVTPVLMSLLTFGTAMLLSGGQLTAAQTFTALALLNMLTAPMNVLPWALMGLADAWVSLRRIQALLDVPDVDLAAYYTTIESDSDVALELNGAAFRFEGTRSRDGLDAAQAAAVVDFQLIDVTMRVRTGELVCLRGPLGGGKTALVNALLARMQPTEGGVRVCDAVVADGFGYVAQTAWLQRGTVRDNIVWGAAFDETRYKRVLFACALVEDLQQLGGDAVGVGEGGQTLSGGQRARVALARAVYQDKAVYLLDDVLSALDGHVANHIVRHCVLGLLAERTRIVVSDHATLLAYADQVFEVAEGGVRAVDAADRQQRPSAQAREQFVRTAAEERENEVASFALEQDAEKVAESGDAVLEEEEMEHGQIKANVLLTYGRAMGLPIAAVVVLMVVAQRATENLTNVWLAHWVSSSSNDTTTDNGTTTNPGLLVGPIDSRTLWNLEVYVGLAGANTLATLARTFLFAYATQRASQLLHVRLLRRVFGARFAFFDATPLGRLLNRFSSDVDIVDNWLPQTLSYMLSTLSGLAGSLLVTVAALPQLLFLVAPLTPVYLRLLRRYRSASRDIRRLSSNALSPLYAQFTETLQGLATVRAMRAQRRFGRAFEAKLTLAMRGQMAGYAAQTWLTMRLQGIGSLLVGGCGVVAAVTSTSSSTSSNAGMVGLAISYALAITDQLAGVMYALASTEQRLIAVERLSKYLEVEQEEVEQEENTANDGVAIPEDWPTKGVIRFSKARLQYRATLAPALLDVDLETRAGERLGIAGRTGAGKSSLLAALFRVAPLSGGSVSVDGVDVRRVSLRRLRQRLTLVPQQPFLFAGTVRENVDTASERSDADIWQALDQCRAAEMVRALGGLSGAVEKAGGNLSAGQKQLLCLTRALLCGTRVVCIDEGTANLDAVAEREVQRVLGEAFAGRTVLIIAHRMTTLRNAERVVVMREGRVVEEGCVEELSRNERSVFYGMLREQREEATEEAAGSELVVVEQY